MRQIHMKKISNNKSENKFNEAEKKSFRRNIFLCVIMILFAVIVVKIPAFEKKKTSEVEFSSVNQICELATLRSYYHDVAGDEKQPDGLFKYGLFKYGYKKFWIEYDGIVELGIDGNEVEVNHQNDDNIVYVYVPDAKILNVTADNESMSDPIVETGMFTSITIEEKTKAFSAAQKTMKENAESDKILLNQAKNNAKILLKQYIVTVGQKIGKEYTVEWLDEPLNYEKEK